MTAPGARAILEGSWRVATGERRIGYEDPIVAQTGTAAVGTVPDDDGIDGRGGPQIDLPPGVRIEVGMSHRVVRKVAVGVAVGRAVGGGAQHRAALGGRFPGGDIQGCSRELIPVAGRGEIHALVLGKELNEYTLAGQAGSDVDSLRGGPAG